MRHMTLASLLLAALAIPAAAAEKADDALGQAGGAARNLRFRPTEGSRPRPAPLPAPGSGGGEDATKTGAPAARISGARILFTPGLTRSLRDEKGEVELKVDADIEGPLLALHEARRSQWRLPPGARSFEDADASELAVRPLASLKVAAHESGWLIGAVRATQSQYQPFQIWAYEVSDDGKAKKLRISAGRLEGQAVICARYSDANDREYQRVIFKPMDTEQDKPPFRSTCGAPAPPAPAAR